MLLCVSLPVCASVCMRVWVHNVVVICVEKKSGGSTAACLCLCVTAKKGLGRCIVRAHKHTQAIMPPPWGHLACSLSCAVL